MRRLHMCRHGPWLAAEGPLAYSPAAPPAKDYFFQYSWIVPGIFGPNTNLREHRYFGSYFKGSAKFLFDFRASARKGGGAALQQYCEQGFSRTSKSRHRSPRMATSANTTTRRAPC